MSELGACDIEPQEPTTKKRKKAIFINVSGAPEGCFRSNKILGDHQTFQILSVHRDVLALPGACPGLHGSDGSSSAVLGSSRPRLDRRCPLGRTKPPTEATEATARYRETGCGRSSWERPFRLHAIQRLAAGEAQEHNHCMFSLEELEMQNIGCSFSLTVSDRTEKYVILWGNKRLKLQVKLHFKERRDCDVHDPMFLRCLSLACIGPQKRWPTNYDDGECVSVCVSLHSFATQGQSLQEVVAVKL